MINYSDFYNSSFKCLFLLLHKYQINSAGKTSSRNLIFYCLKHLHRHDYEFIVDECSQSKKFEALKYTKTYNFFFIFQFLYGFLLFILNKRDNLNNLIYEKLVKDFCLDEINNRADRIITFCDAMPEDHTIAFYFKKNNKQTFTLQHGIYQKTKVKRLENNAFNKFISDKMFVWGESTIFEATKANIDVSRFEITGYPFKESLPFDINYKLNQKVLVLLNASKDSKYNKQLVNCISSLPSNDYTFVIKSHPNDHTNYAKLGLKTYSKKEQTFQLVIGISSGALFAPIVNNVPILMFKTEITPKSFLKKFPFFENASEFLTHTSTKERIISDSSYFVG